MPRADAGIRFREVMRGPFALGESDPREGARAGLRAGTELLLHASLSVPEVAQFASDSQHRGVLDGTIGFAPMASQLSVTDGAFQLFTRGPDGKLMVYRATFAHRGAAYCFNGVKRLGAGGILHSWKETTTLYSTLHSGADPSGQVVGAGILRLSPAALVRQLGTFAPVRCGRLSERARGFSRFLAFFAGELIDTYVLHPFPQRRGVHD